MALHEIKQGDNRPYHAVTLTFSDGSVPDLTGATVRYLARYRTDLVTLKINAAAVVTDIPTAAVEYRFTTTDTDTAGLYDVEWEVTFADGTIQTFPTRRYDRLRVIGELE